MKRIFEESFRNGASRASDCTGWAESGEISSLIESGNGAGSKTLGIVRSREWRELR